MAWTTTSTTTTPSSSLTSMTTSNSINNNEGGTSTGSFVLRVAVGSSNPAKIRAAEDALRKALFSTKRPQRHWHNHHQRNDDDNDNGDSSNASTTIVPPEIQLEVEGFDVESGVSHQPYGDDETSQGAKNRSKAAFAEYRRTHNGRPPHMAIGMEGGLEWRRVVRPAASSVSSASGEHTADESEERPNKSSLYCMAWMSIYGRREAMVVDMFASADTSTYYGDRLPVFGLAKTATFPLPPKISE